MTTAPVWAITSSPVLFTAGDLVVISNSTLPSLINSNAGAVKFSVIAGKLPLGLSLSANGVISGTTSAILSTVTSKFVIRASNIHGIADKTFTSTITGTDIPVWNNMPLDYLEAGIGGDHTYILNKQWVDYQLEAQAIQAPAGTILTYTSTSTLPPGLKLLKSGKITGFLDDQFAVNVNSNTYQFDVKVSDGVASSTITFRILSVNPNAFRADNTASWTITSLDASISYLQPVQWLINANLGVIRTNNNETIPVIAYDPNPSTGDVTYRIVEGSSIQSKPPQKLLLDKTTGYIYGVTLYQAVYTKTHVLNTEGIKTDKISGSTVTAVNTFTLTVNNVVLDSLKWASPDNIGTIEAGVTSELSIKATNDDPNCSIKYTITAGSLPSGLVLDNTGIIVGRAAYNGTGTYTISVSAHDVYQLSTIHNEFTLTVIELDTQKYNEIYAKPFLDLDQRDTYSEFMSRTDIFDPSLMYRFNDPSFGIQYEPKIVIEYSIEVVTLGEYGVALRDNFFRTRLFSNGLNMASGKTPDGTHVYDVVYISIDDRPSTNLLNGKHMSIHNMREALESVIVYGYRTVKTNPSSTPVFMNTIQESTKTAPGYQSMIILCYTLPGHGAAIAKRIERAMFDFKILDFDIDRLIIKSSVDEIRPAYLLLERGALNIS